MAKTVGFTLSVGARLQSSVGSVFDTVAGRASKLKREMGQLKAVSGAAGKLTTAKARLDVLRGEAAAGKDVSAQLGAAKRAFTSAQRSANQYGITIKNVASVHAQATAQMQRTQDALKRQETYQRNAAKRSELKGEIVGTIASVAAVAAPINMAMNFESAMADAAKTIDGMRDSAGKLTPEYYKLEATVKRMGRELPLTHQELASIFAAGGQLGLTQAEDLEEFTRLVAHMSVSFGMSTEAAAEAVGGYRSQMNKSFPEIREMLDLMNQYGNTSSATESSIAHIVKSVGSLGETAGLSDKSLTAMAATLASMKIQDDKASTGLKNFLLTFTSGEFAAKSKQIAFQRLGIDPKKLAKQMQKDAEGAMLAVLKKIKSQEKDMQAGFLEELFGRESIGAIAPLLTQLDLLEDNFKQAGDTAAYAGAMQKEFENRARTTANAAIITKNKMSELGITVGSFLLPSFNELLSVVGAGAVALAGFAQANPEVVTTTMQVVGALVAFRVASLAGRWGLTVLSDGWTMVKGVWAAARVLCSLNTYAMIAQRTASVGLAAGVRMVAAAQWVLNAAMSNNPIGWVIKGVMFLGVALGTLYSTCEPVRNVLNNLWDGFLEKMKPVTEKLTWVWDKIKSIKSWFDDDADATEAKADQQIAAKEGKTPPAGGAASVQPVVAPSSLPASPVGAAMPQNNAANAEVDAFVKSAPAQPSQSEIEKMMAQQGAAMPMGAVAPAPVTIAPTFQFSFAMDGIPDKDFGKRVLESVEAEKTALQRILSGLLADAQRVAYE